MNGHFPQKPSRRAAPHSRRKRFAVAKVDKHGVDRRHAGGGGAGEAQRARQSIRVEKHPFRVAVGLGAELGGKIFGAPGQCAQPLAARLHRCPQETEPPRFRWRSLTILIWPSAQAALSLRAPRAWRRRVRSDAPPSAFGSMMASGACRRDGVEVGVGQAGLQAVDAD